MSTRKKAVLAADKAFSLMIRNRDRRCVVCGSTERLTCGHLFSRAHYSTRWDPENAFCQCAPCNFRHEFDPGPLTLYYLSLYGAAKYSALHARFSRPAKLSVEDIREITRRLSC